VAVVAHARIVRLRLDVELLPAADAQSDFLPPFSSHTHMSLRETLAVAAGPHMCSVLAGCYLQRARALLFLKAIIPTRSEAEGVTASAVS